MCQSVVAESLLCSLVTLEEDDVWKWNSLSKIVSAINSTGTWTATLLVPDAPAVRLCHQTNEGLAMPYECVVSEVGLIGLSDPSLPTIAATPSGGLAFQVREFIRAIAEVGEAMVIAQAMTWGAVFDQHHRVSCNLNLHHVVLHYVLRGGK